MTKSIIETIYNAERTFYAEAVTTEEYRRAKKEFCESYEKLFNTLDERQKSALEKLFNLRCNVESAGQIKKFKDGFITGFKLAQEVFCDN